MPKVITNNATMQCSLGTKTAQIQVTSQVFSTIKGEHIATEQDNDSMTNIPTFGNCKCVWYQPACIPSPIQWNNTALSNKINGMSQLTEESQCSCAKGGIITFTNTGVNTFSGTD